MTPSYRCIAPDLIGMRLSDKADIRYRFCVDHACYIEAFLDALQLERVVWYAAIQRLAAVVPKRTNPWCFCSHSCCLGVVG